MTTMTMMTTRRNARIDRRPSSRALKRGSRPRGREGGALPSLLADLSSRRKASWVAGRGSISDTPDRSLCRRDPVSSPSPCSRRSRPEIISSALFFFIRGSVLGDATARESVLIGLGIGKMYNSVEGGEHGQINRMIISLAVVLSDRISGISFPGTSDERSHEIGLSLLRHNHVNKIRLIFPIFMLFA